MARMVSASADRSAARLWAAVKLLGLLCIAALALQAVRLPSSTEAPEPPRDAGSPLTAARAWPAIAAGLSPAPEIPPVRRWLDPERPLQHGDYVWDEGDAPAGRVRILIDLSGQMLHVFRGGQEIGRAVILYGTDEQPTPTGIFRITEKDIDHVSNLYEAIMPYMLRLTDDGIAIHGSNVRFGWASRGCIGVPDEFAALLFEQARLGDVVTIVGGAPAAAAPSPSAG